MDWMSHTSVRPLSSFSQLSRATHVTEFVPRVLSSNNSASASPNFLSSFPSVNTQVYHNVPKKSDDPDNISSHVTPESQTPSHSINSSPVLHDKLVNQPIVPAYQENVGGTTYFYQYAANAENNLDHCHPVDVPPNVATTSAPNNEYQPYPPKSEMSYFMSEELRNDIMNRNMLSMLQADPQQYPDLPAEVDSYHELFPLEPVSTQPLHKSHMGYPATMYKATHMKTGLHYCLRRIHGFHLQNTKGLSCVDLWKNLSHSNIVQLRDVFPTQAFGDHSLIFVYDFYPGSETLLNRHFSPDQIGYCDPFTTDNSTPRPYSYQKNNILRHQQVHKLPEPLIWNYIIQLTAALRVIHTAGLACRSMDPTKIVLTSKNRLRLSCVGTMDVVLFDQSASINHVALVQHYQQEDLSALGKLILALACKSTVAVQRENMTTALDIVGKTYTPDLKNMIMYLLATTQRRSVTDLMPMIGARFYTQLDNQQNHIEVLDQEISKEIQNGRLFRLMTKLCMINERPEFNMESTWSETGDRYMLKLFRDYVFHQVTEDGRPWLDCGHVIQCLNKLDVGVPERVCLVSRDEQSVLVISYAELKNCLDQSFQELVNASSIPVDELSTLIDEKL